MHTPIAQKPVDGQSVLSPHAMLLAEFEYAVMEDVGLQTLHAVAALATPGAWGGGGTPTMEHRSWHVLTAVKGAVGVLPAP